MNPRTRRQRRRRRKWGDRPAWYGGNVCRSRVLCQLPDPMSEQPAVDRMRWVTPSRW